MPDGYRKTRTTGLYVRHRRSCPAYENERGRCRCEPSYRTRRWIDGKALWSPVFKDRSSAISWDGHEARAAQAARTMRRRGPTFGDVAAEWWSLVETGKYARRGRGKRLSETTIGDYRGVLFGRSKEKRKRGGSDSFVLMERCGGLPIAALDDA